MEMYSLRNIVSLVGVTGLILCSPHALAQYATAAEIAAKEATERAEKELAFKNELVGKTLWVIPSSASVSSVYMFCKDPKEVFETICSTAFFPTRPTNFQVQELVTGKNWKGYASYAYKVRFEDGLEAFISAFALGDTWAWRPQRLSNKLRDVESNYNNVFFTESPDAIRAAAAQAAAEAKEKEQNEQKALAEAEAQRAKARLAAAKDAKRRGGVHIGMSAKQVRASNWGAPYSVNRTTTANGVSEQWVYGSSSYLYFQNGRLTAIQN